jgi:PAS domain S-box-containing protein
LERLNSDPEQTLNPSEICVPAPEALIHWLQANRGQIVDEWIERVFAGSSFYRQRPRKELVQTITEAFDSHLEILSVCDFTRYERFINFITALRLATGFPLVDVQRALELFRFVVVERLSAEGLSELLLESVPSINACMARSLSLFSDLFQRMHELTLRQYAENLEREIGVRTAELAESQRRYKTLVEEINDGYFVVQNQRITFANQAFCRMHGTGLQEVLGRPFLAFVSPDRRQSVGDLFAGVLEGRPVSGQMQYSRTGAPQDKAATEVKARVVDLGQGPVIIGICRDISERVAMEAKVREHERMAYVGRLSASLSHEIRNPLSAVKMNLQILERKLDLDGFDRRRLEITGRQVSRLEGILRQLLDIARPLTITKAPVNLSVLAAGCVDLLEAKAHEKGVSFTERYPRTLPPVYADAGKVEQAVINLLLNAIEATPQGGRITVWTKVERGENPYVELGVRDTGHGIDLESTTDIFTPFFTSKSHGSGLGLSNVKRIVEAHSGEVAVRSRKGKGATFALRLPCGR